MFSQQLCKMQQINDSFKEKKKKQNKQRRGINRQNIVYGSMKYFTEQKKTESHKIPAH